MRYRSLFPYVNSVFTQAVILQPFFCNRMSTIELQNDRIWPHFLERQDMNDIEYICHAPNANKLERVIICRSVTQHGTNCLFSMQTAVNAMTFFDFIVLIDIAPMTFMDLLS